MTYHCLIVDDEPIARDILLNYCRQVPYLNVVGMAGNAMEARAILQQQLVDILFLDINMPVLDGLSFLKSLRVPPAVIFTTAYKEYAIDAFDLSASDYLLKPFSLDRFLTAVDKALAVKGSVTQVAGGTTAIPGMVPVSGKPEDDYLFIKADGKIFRIAFDDILYAEASGNYTRIECFNQNLLPAISFTAMAEQLPASRFIRVHRSFIINKSKISHVEGNRVYIGGKEIPIGSNYKEDFLNQLGFRNS